MKFDFDAKTWVSLAVSVLTVAIQAVQGVYADGITGLEWLGIVAILLGPAGVVAAVNNTPWDPAKKAVVQSVSAVAIVVVQGIQGVYAGGITHEEWLGLALLLLSNLAVYYVPGPNSSTAVPARNDVGASPVLLACAAAAVIGVLLVLFTTAQGIGWLLVVLGAVGVVVALILDRDGRSSRV